MTLIVNTEQVIMKGIIEEGESSDVYCDQLIQKCINGSVIAGFHNNVQVMPVTESLKQCMSFKILC
jgi:hypothetical protein